MDKNTDILTDFEPFFSSNTLSHTSVGLTSCISTVFFSLKIVDPYDHYAACWFPLTEHQSGMKPIKPLGQRWVSPIVAFYDQQGLLRAYLPSESSIRSPHPGSHGGDNYDRF